MVQDNLGCYSSLFGFGASFHKICGVAIEAIKTEEWVSFK